MEKKLRKIKSQAKIDGVCAGFAEYFDIDVTLVRLGFILLCFLPFSGFLFYLVCMLVMPSEY